MNRRDTGKPSKTDWARVDELTDAELVDPENPPLDESFWKEAVFVPGPKRQITLRIDADVLDFFRSQGPGYQRRMNAVLRRYFEAHRKA